MCDKRHWDFVVTSRSKTRNCILSRLINCSCVEVFTHESDVKRERKRQKSAFLCMPMWWLTWLYLATEAPTICTADIGLQITVRPTNAK